MPPSRSFSLSSRTVAAIVCCLAAMTAMTATAFQPALPLNRHNRIATTIQSTTEDVGEEIDYEVPEDAVVVIKPPAMKRLRELKEQQKTDSLVLRMGVRNGGCSGLSYVMDFAEEADIEEDDVIDTYATEGIQCVVDAKSMLYLYGLELDYSTELIGGGFKFFNPNAEDSCGCGSSFAV
uniref:Core domain-containing protein n=1 Tax=Craspedostauros australis TaxID=1486917 RepID=A0A7R9WRR4_9STRA|mmetsp:Transcript_1769/g.4896  ORF Transcript_1769/g.4896 Transcript_1769/m.4896 type:complete len:179 (+) Transcript_1769:285-821(+)